MGFADDLLLFAGVKYLNKQTTLSMKGGEMIEHKNLSSSHITELCLAKAVLKMNAPMI